ncbi:nucleoside deaminase [Oxalobacteraceae bacterium R-40]|uniref:Nucleoside deaminase n=1 Tax=Keguizhuia sedimenti TaxID=3064264 RepID=A0ABU1BKR6_9BURK|nr:nucleoside deaminase [Oxalobacteraceae bacterium R-40]
MKNHQQFLKEAVRLAQSNRADGGRPFGAVLTLNGIEVATGVNRIIQCNDPTAHAEMEAIRTASQTLKSPNLTGAVMYASGHPCPMCMAALIMSGISEVYYAFDNTDAEPYGFSSRHVYEKLNISLKAAPITLTRIDTGTNADQVYGS